MFNLRLFFIIVVFALSSCGTISESQQKKHVADQPIFGWFDGRCFATLENSLAPKTEILVVRLDAPQTLMSAEVIGLANPHDCAPLSRDRREQNEAEGYTFYAVKQSQVFGLAIGIVGAVVESRTENGIVFADLDSDGTFEQFTHCATSEGISFDIWGATPYKDKPIWSGYYYLGYDVERNCP